MSEIKSAYIEGANSCDGLIKSLRARIAELEAENARLKKQLKKIINAIIDIYRTDKQKCKFCGNNLMNNHDSECIVFKIDEMLKGGGDE